MGIPFIRSFDEGEHVQVIATKGDVVALEFVIKFGSGPFPVIGEGPTCVSLKTTDGNKNVPKVSVQSIYR